VLQQFSAVSSSQNQSVKSGSLNKYPLEWHHYFCLNALTYPPFLTFSKKILHHPTILIINKKTLKLEKNGFFGKNGIFGKIERKEYIFTFEK
jgi:hypothetical protein